MSVVEPGTVRSESLIDRVKAILLSPGAAWDRIDAEPATISGLYTGYVGILVGISVVAGLIGSLVFGYGAFGFVYRPSIISAVVNAIVSYALALAMVFVLALVIDALAPSFDGQKNQIQALKVAAYSGTAGWVAGIFGIIPALAPLALLGSLYGLYLLYLGLPKLMKAPQEKALGYTIVTIVVAIVLFMIVGAIGGALAVGAGGFGHFGGAGLTSNSGNVSGTLHLGGANVDLGKLQAASQQMQAAANQVQAQQNGQPPPAGAIKAVPVEALKALLPAALPAGFARTESSSTSGGVAGVAAASAEGVYSRGDQKITLQVTDMAAMGALATLGGAVDIQQDKETPSGYEKIGKIDGRLTTEQFDRPSKTGKYSVLVASRFMVEADGQGVDIGDLKGAVASVGLDRLEGLAHG